MCSEMLACASDSGPRTNQVFQTGVYISDFCWIVIFSVVAPALLSLPMLCACLDHCSDHSCASSLLSAFSC